MNETTATKLIFFVAGLATSSWAAMVPFAKENTGIDEAQLGFLLLALGSGALISMPIAGPLSSRFGCRKLITAGIILMIFALPFLTQTHSKIMLAILLLTFGTGIGTIDCVMNIQAILVEKNENKNLMSGFHGMYSIGGIAGAGIMTILLSFEITAQEAALAITGIIFTILIASYKELLPYANSNDKLKIARPTKYVFFLGIICFIVFLAEGSILDWSAIFLVNVKKYKVTQGGLGFTFFALSMTAVRLIGDKILHKIGTVSVVILGSLLTILGFAIILISNSFYIILTGHLIIGAGCANIVPAMFSQIGKQNKMPQELAVSVVTSMGYLGVLAGPGIVGYSAQHSSLSYAFFGVSLLMLLTAVLGLRINKMQH